MSTEIGWTWVPDGKGGTKVGRTWNPQVGCKEVSPACRSCYAAKLAHRSNGEKPMVKQHHGLTVMRTNAAGENLGAHWNGKINRVPQLLAQPLRWAKPSGIFVGSMTDLFYDVSTDEACRWIAAIFGIMAATPRHTYMLLTKRPENAAKWFAWIKDALAWGERDRGEIAVLAEALCEQAVDWPKWVGSEGDGLMELLDDAEWPLRNVRIGVTAEDQPRADERIPILLELPAAGHYVSYEPALGPVNFSPWLEKRPRKNEAPRIDWVICGGESGSGARPMHPDWARSARDQCLETGTPFFFKQWGEWWPEREADDVRDLGWLDASEVDRVHRTDLPTPVQMRRVGKKLAGRELDGRTWDGFPP